MQASPAYTVQLKAHTHTHLSFSSASRTFNRSKKTNEHGSMKSDSSTHIKGKVQVLEHSLSRHYMPTAGITCWLSMFGKMFQAWDGEWTNKMGKKKKKELNTEKNSFWSKKSNKVCLVFAETLTDIVAHSFNRLFCDYPCPAWEQRPLYLKFLVITDSLKLQVLSFNYARWVSRRSTINARSLNPDN